ncbi:MAG: hypothetical protein IJD01_04860 [Clostridia bacterium]|nr:hypothetical protein [Clostridia bacterium]
MRKSIGQWLLRIVLTVMLALILASCAVTAAVFVMSSFGVSWPPSSETSFETVPAPDYDTNPYYTNLLQIECLDNGYYYARLDEGLQRQYEYILHEVLRTATEDTALSDGGDGISLTLRGYAHTEETLETLFFSVYNDHPELFFLRSGYTYSCRGKTATLGLRYSMNAAERIAAQKAVTDVIRTLGEGCRETDPYAVELYYHDALVTRCTYDEEAAKADSDSLLFARSSSPYAALVEGRAICGGYARAMHWLLAEAGVRSTVICNDDHAWNMVWIDGEPYHLDPTWNDTEDAFIMHSYFNVTDADLLSGRELDIRTATFPTATATQANYYYREGIFVEAVPSEALTEAIRTQVEQGETCVELRFAPSVYQEALRYVDSGEVFAAFGFLDEEEELAIWRRIAYSTDDRVHTVVLTASGS